MNLNKMAADSTLKTNITQKGSLLRIATVKSLMFLCLGAAVTVVLFNLFSMKFHKNSIFSNYGLQIPEVKSTFSNKNPMIVDTPGCKIQYFHPLDPTVKDLVKKMKPLKCGVRGLPPLTKVVNKTFYIDTSLFERYGAPESELNEKTNFTCCVSRIRRGRNDKRYSISNVGCHHNKTAIKLRKPFVKVDCTVDKLVYTSYHAVNFLSRQVEERCEENAPRNNGTPPSVLMIGVDAVSRLNFNRQCPKLRKFLKTRLHAVEMFGYNKVGDNTFPNLVPVLTGMSEDEMVRECWRDRDGPFDNCTFVWSMFETAGYRTATAEDSPNISTFNYNMDGFEEQPTDYYPRPLLSAAFRDIATNKSGNVNTCLGQDPQIQLLLDWLSDLISTLRGKPYFALTWSNSITHDYVNHAQWVEGPILDLLENAYDKGYLNNTIVILMSDHGQRWGNIRQTYVGRLEERLPLIYVSLPEGLRREKKGWFDALKVNARRLTSPFDVHQTLLHVLRAFDPEHEDIYYPPFSNNKGSSLFEEISPKRTCEDAGIIAQWCACVNSVPINVTDNFVVKAANAFLDHLNDIASSERGMCAPLSLKEILNARRSGGSDEIISAKEGHTTDYFITISVEPSLAIFEATVRYFEKDEDSEVFQTMGDFSRLNLYGNQSYCVHNPVSKKVCYCKKKNLT